MSVSVFRINAQLYPYGEYLTNSYNHSSSTIREIELLDIDNDGDKDIVAAMGTGLFWYENTGSGHLNTRHIIDGELAYWNGILELDVRDMDSDGFYDLVFTHQNGKILSLMYNLGNGQFGQPITLISNPSQIVHFETALIDNDGLPDIVWMETGSNVYIQLNDGALFATQVSVTASTPITFFDVTDYNSDGKADIVVANNTIYPLERYTGDGNGGFTYLNSSYHYPPESPGRIEHSDLDADGTPDAFTKLGWHNGIFRLLLYSDDYNGVNPADLDNDGDLDVIVSAGFLPDDGAYIYENTQSDTPVYHELKGILKKGGKSLLVDIDNDNLEDLIWSNHFNLMFGKRNGPFSFDSAIVVTNNAVYVEESVHVADVDGDGYDDIVTSDRGPDGYDSRRLVYYKTSPFTSPAQIVIDDTSANVGFVLATTDMNSDGQKDFISCHLGTVYIYVSNSGSYIKTGPVYTATGTIENILCEDIDNDGDQDLFLIFNSNPPSILENDGIGGIVASHQLSGFGSPNLYLEDLNNDGLPDIIQSTGYAISVAFGQGNFAFGSGPSPVWYNPTISAAALAAIDYDGDGDKDFVFPLYSPISSYVFIENDGSGAFANHQLFGPTLNNPKGHLVYDFDNDGDFDHFLNDQGNAYLIINQGNSYQQIFLGITTETPLLFDFEGDGDKDVLVGVDELRLFRNLSDIPFQISGSVYQDLNEDGIKDPSEIPLNSGWVSINPSGVLTTPLAGDYIFYASPGTFSVSPIIPANWSITSDSSSYTTTLSSSNPTSSGNDFGLAPDSLYKVLTVDVTNLNASCNQDGWIWITVCNTGTLLTDAYVKLEMAQNLTYITSYPATDSIIGDFLYWSFDSLQPFECRLIKMLVLNPPASLFGTELQNHTMVCDSVSFNTQLLTADTTSDIVTCAYDPNDKIAVPGGYYTPHFIAGDESIEYTIRFQNTGNDTATHVMIEDQLDPLLDVSTFEFVSSSHPASVTLTTNNLLKFDLTNIFLPDSGTSYLNSQGFVKYRVKTDTNAVPNDEINNSAAIFFDSNAPVITNNVRHKIIDCKTIHPLTVSHAAPCQTDTIVLSGYDEYIDSYTWIFGTDTVGSSQTLNFYPDTAGSYTIFYSARNPLCSFDTTLNFTVTSAPTALINSGGDSTICQYDSLMVSAGAMDSYDWTFNGQSMGNTSNVYIDSSGTLILSGQLSGCNAFPDTLSVEQIVQPSAIITGMDTICLGDSTVLYSDSLSGNHWYFNAVEVSDSSILTVTDSGWISLVVEDHQCISETDSIHVFVQVEYATINTPTDTICNTDSLLLQSAIADSYQWQDPFGNTTSGPNLVASDSGWYFLQVISGGCTSLMDSTYLHRVIPIADLTDDYTYFCGDDSVELVSNGNQSLWYNAQGVLGSSMSQFVSDTGWIFLVVQEFGCESDPDSIFVSRANNPNPDIIWNGSILTGGSFPVIAWYLDGNELFGQHDSLTNIVNGTYVIVVEDSLGCVGSDTLHITDVGIVMPGDRNDILIYPNPANHAVHIIAPGIMVETDLISIDGRLVIEGFKGHNLNLSNVANGTYMLRIRSQENKSTLHVQTLIIAH